MFCFGKMNLFCLKLWKELSNMRILLLQSNFFCSFLLERFQILAWKHFDHSAIIDMCVGVYRVSSLNFLDQVNSGSVAGDLETGTPVPQEVPENVQVLKRLLLGSSECVFLTYRYFLYVYQFIAVTYLSHSNNNKNNILTVSISNFPQFWYVYCHLKLCLLPFKTLQQRMK